MPPYQSPFRMPDWQQQLIDLVLNQRQTTPDIAPGLSPAENAMSAGANVRDLYMQALSEQPRINDELDQYLADEKANAAAEEEFNKKLFAANAAHRMDLETEAFKQQIKPVQSVNKLGQQVESSRSSKEIMDALNALVGAKPTATDSEVRPDASGVYRNYPVTNSTATPPPPRTGKRMTPSAPPSSSNQIINPKSIGGKVVNELGSEDVGNKVMKGLNDVAQVHPLVKAASLAFSKDPSEITIDDIAKLIKSFSPIGATMELQKVWNKAVAPNYFK